MTPGEVTPAPPTLCRFCTGFLRLTVHDGRWGPLVAAECETCHLVTDPYEGPGSWEAVRDWIKVRYGAR